LGIEGVETAETFEDIEKAVADFENKALEGVDADIEGFIQNLKGLSSQTEVLGGKMSEATKDIKA
jgi:hypothetical protein